jgi:hypothetical protein
LTGQPHIPNRTVRAASAWRASAPATDATLVADVRRWPGRHARGRARSPGGGQPGRRADRLDLALRALGKATDTGLIDITWLRGCPLFAPITGDLRWRSAHDAVEQRAAAMRAAFRAAAE